MAKLDFIHYVSLIWNKSISDLKSEARRGYLGILWWVIEPILYLSVFYVIFVMIFKSRSEDAVAFLLVGLVVWKWFSASILQCSVCITSNIGLIRQVSISKTIFPLMTVLSATLKFLIVFFLLILFLIYLGEVPTYQWISIPFVLIAQLLMMLAIGTILAVAVPFLPDIKLVVDNGMTLLFFLSGVFFDISDAPEDIQHYLYLNPMVALIESYRTILIDDHYPDWNILGVLSVISIVVFMAGLILMRKYSGRFVKVL